MIQCLLCTKTFPNQAQLNAHTISHTKEKSHKCHICSATFGYASSVKEHIKTVHDGIKRIRNRNHHCPLCSFKCIGKTNLQIHLRKHSAQRPFSCNIPGCGYNSKYKRAIQRHIRFVHCNERPFECPLDGCNYKAKSSTDVQKHLKVHSDEKPFACTAPGCSYTSRFKFNLKSHTFRVHSHQKPFKCSICNFRTKSSTNLKSHQLTHTKTKRFHCQAPNCYFACYHRSGLELHLSRKHRKKVVSCTQPGCNFRYGSIALLKRHLRNHEKPLFKCPSDTCNYSTKFPHLYDRHRITHTKEKNRQLICLFCFSRYSRMSHLKDHLRRHVGEKPYSCSLCNYAFAASYDLSAHARKFHHIHVIPRCVEYDEKTCRTCGRNCLSHIDFVLHSMSHLQPVVVLERLRVNFS